MPEYPYDHYVGEHPVDTEPTVDELYQQEPIGVAVPVDVGGPIKVQDMGALDGAIYGVVVDDVTGGKIINSDRRRSAITVIPFDQPIFLAMSLSEVQSNVAAPILKGQSVTIKNVHRLFARSATPGSSAKVAVFADQWSL